jgi:(1->4)-alpha-D-glucan 1-alpha-D-glucosylmutase
VYRAYVVPGEPAPQQAVDVFDEVFAQCVATHPRLADELEYVRDLALERRSSRDAGKRAEFVVRFQQTCGPVMAKGVEDTTFYRWHRLDALNEVGGRPEVFAVFPDDLHSWATKQQQSYPHSMTTLSTHDTKRSEDVRARLVTLSEVPDQWRAAVAAWGALAGPYRAAAGWPDPETEYLMWQTLVGTWPITPGRLTDYLQKAAREAKRHTTWTDPDTEYESALADFATAVLADDAITAQVEQFVADTAAWARVATLTTKLVQLTLPGVPDIYQGCELVDLSLVDPDNRRAVDYQARAHRLAALDAGDPPQGLSDEKLRVTAAAVRTRREHPEWFGSQGDYQPLPTTTTHALAFVRSGSAATVATRRPAELAAGGGWRDAQVVLPEGRWVDRITGQAHEGGSVALVRLLDQSPVALLVREA